MNRKIKYLIFALFLLGNIFSLYSQEIITADRYLARVAERYANIRDYEAQVIIHSDGTDMHGSLSFLDPNFLRIDFTNPSNQVLIFNGEVLTIHLPLLRAVLSQTVSPLRRASTPMTGSSMASSQGLQLLQRGYIAAFLVGPDPVMLDERNPEMVVKLRLTGRLASESFREIIISINPETLLIRRIEGRTLTDSMVRFDFMNIRTNLGIPEQRFSYDLPPTANVFHNFLFRDID